MKKWKYMVEAAGFLLMLVLVIIFLGRLTRPTDTDSSVASIQAFHRVPENSLDVIAYGSSHMWKGLDTKVLSEKYGISAYNYSCNWQHINTTRLFVEDSLISQRPKAALIETYKINELLKDLELNGEIYYTKYLRRTASTGRFLKQCFGNDFEKYLAYYFPLAVFHENWKNIKQNSFLSMEAEQNAFLENRGYRTREDTVPVSIGDSTLFEQKALSPEAVAELDYITDLLKGQGILVIFVTIPYEGEFNFGNAVREYAYSRGCEYVNLFEHLSEMGLNEETDFNDAGHMNSLGGAKAGEFMGRYLEEHHPEILV